MGLSPRVRGKLDWPPSKQHVRGSIPACAGETPDKNPRTELHQVYPRVCGGNVKSTERPISPTGLSPRVRGKLKKTILNFKQKRSIPACAGETVEAYLPPVFMRVYPRVCGGNVVLFFLKDNVEGLSPRVRGKLLDIRSAMLNCGSIPACAGETESRI